MNPQDILDIQGAMVELGEEIARIEQSQEFDLKAAGDPVLYMEMMTRQSRDVAARAVMHWLILRASHRGAIATGAYKAAQKGTH